MQQTTRPATQAELQAAFQHLSTLQSSERTVARREKALGIVEEMTFDVARVWATITCSGPPCCPAEWVIETADGDYNEITSWHHLVEQSGQFPGRTVKVTIWPESKRIITAETSGAPLDLRFCDAELAAKMRVLPDAAPEV